MTQFVEPTVSRAKFDLEIAAFRGRQTEYRRRGILLLEASFPRALVAFAAVHLDRCPVPFGVLFDFTNYNAHPMSVNFQNPFSGQALSAGRLPVVEAVEALVPDPAAPGGSRIEQRPPRSLIVQHAGSEAMLCLRGVLEYHQHPAHTGNSWELYRGQGVGTLSNLLENIHMYGVVGLGELVQIITQIATVNPQK